MLRSDYLETLVRSFGVWTGFFMSVSSRRLEQGVATGRRERTALHSVIALFLVSRFAVSFRSDPTTVLGPSAVRLFLRVQLRVGWTPSWLLVVPVPVPAVLAVVTFLLVNVLPSSRHPHHTSVSPVLALDQLVLIVRVFGDRDATDALDHVVHSEKLFLVIAYTLVYRPSPGWHSYFTADDVMFALD